MPAKPFTGAEFKPTKWETAEDKAKFANHFVRFLQNDCSESLFYDWFYRRLSSCFGHIAHYNRQGFFATWFETPEQRADFMRHTIAATVYGDPTCTYNDVERAIQGWLHNHPILVGCYERATQDDTETAERAELARLQAKYPADAP